MSSATKALSLLSYFSTTRPEIGLSQMRRITGRDKTTVYRHLQALEDAGFIEQNPATRQYRLGPAVLQLAEIREATVPRKASTTATLNTLASATGESAHATVLSGTTLYGLCKCESSQHGTRAIIDLNVFPLHATASGLCAITFGSKALFSAALAELKGYTPNTPTSQADLLALVEKTRETGFAHANQSYEAEIQGLAAPVFDHSDNLAGAVAVASVASRFTPELELNIKSALIIAAREITRNWGGTIPAFIEAAWAKSVTLSNE